MSKPKFYLTTPIYYANSRPHVGSAYTTIVCDVIARYKRMCGYDVAYLTGTDEHGVNIERAAEKQGITPQQLVDKNEKIFRELWKLLGITNTEFIRTTEPRHARAVQNLVRRTIERDKDLETSKQAIYKKKYEGRYCIYDNLYVSDTPEPADCQICGRPGELVSEENYFFRLSTYQQKLLELYKNNPHFVHPDFRFNEVKSFVESGLKDISISRKSIKWGIPWPDDPEHVFYVWYDALTSYMSGIGYGEGPDGEANPQFKKFWPANLHMIGKEIIRFHAVYWPAFLMAAGLPLPEKIFAHGWLLFEESKMSKSRGNIVRTETILDVLGSDALRYFLLREIVFGQDGSFSFDALVQRYNSDLANGLGNLASRTLTMIKRYFHGEVPYPSHAATKTEAEDAIADVAQKTIREFGVLFDQFQFSRALEAVWALIAAVDRYIVENEPWALGEKQDEDSRSRLATVLYTAAEALRIATALAYPVMPEATAKIWSQMGLGDIKNLALSELAWGQLPLGTKLGEVQPVFPRADKSAIERMQKMEEEQRSTPVAEASAAQTSAPQAAAAPVAAQAAAPADEEI